MDASFEIIKSLQYQLKAANTQLLAFQSGEKLIQMEADYHKKIKELEKKNQKLKSELAKAHKDIISIRNQWFEIFEELEKEMKKERKEYQKKLGAMEQRALNAEQQRDKALEKITQQRQKMYQIESAFEEELQIIEKNQIKSKEHNQDIRDMVERNRFQQQNPFCCHHHKKC